MRISHLFLFLFFFSFIFSQDDKEKRLALVIGNSDYDLAILKNPVNDAKLIREKLDSLGFDVIEAYNLETQRDFYDVIDEFGDKRPDYDTGFVYYAGHGAQIDGENFLLPTKEAIRTMRDIGRYGVSAQEILKFLETQSDQVNILVLDACRNNPYEASRGGSGLADITPPSGSLIAYSAGPGKLAFDGDGTNSLYALSLSRNMMIERIPIQQVFTNVRTEIEKATEFGQSPVEEVKLTGQAFYLNPGNNDDEFKEVEQIINGEGIFANQYSKGFEILNTIQKNNPSDNEIFKLMLYRFFLLRDSGEYTRARAQLIGLQARSLFKIAGLYHHSAKLHITVDGFKGNIKALDDFNKAIELEPDNQEFLFDRGSYYYRNSNYEKALLDYKYVYDLDNNIQALKWIGWSHIGLNQNDDANEAFISYLEQGGTDPSVFERLAKFSQNDLPKTSLDLLNNGIELNSDNNDGLIKLYLQRAELHYSLKDFNKSLIDINNVIEIDSTNSDAYFKRSGYYRNVENDYLKSIADLKKAIDLNPDYSSAYFSLAYTYYNTGMVENSIGTYLRYIEKFGNDYNVFNNIGLIYRDDLKNYEKALEFFNKSIEMTNNYLPVMNRARLYMKMERNDDAIKDFNKAIELDPNIALIYYYRAREYYESNEDYDKALIDYKKALELKPDDTTYMFKVAYAASNSSNKKEALEYYLKILEIQPDESSTLNNVALIYDGDFGNFEKALEFYGKAIKVDPEVSMYYRNRAQLLDKLQRNEEALDDYNKAVELEPIALNYWKRSEYYKKIEKYQEALIDSKKSLDLYPNDSDYIFQTAYLYSATNQYENAIGLYLNYIDKFGEDASVLNNISLIYQNDIGDLEKALEYRDILINYIESNYDDFILAYGTDYVAKYYRFRAELYLDELNQPDKALIDFNKSIEISPNSAVNYYNRAFYYDEMSDFDKSLSDFKKAYELDPNDEIYLYMLSTTLYDAGDYDEALKYYKEYLEIEEDDYITASVGEIYDQKGQYELALKYYNRAIELDDKDDYYYLLRGNLYHLKLNNNSNALEDFNKAIELDPEYYQNFLQRAYFYQNIDEHENAIEDFKIAYEKNSECDSCLFNLGYSNSEIGNFENSIASYFTYLEKFEPDETIYNNIGRIYQNDLNDNEKALEYYNKSLEIKPIEVTYLNMATIYFDNNNQENALSYLNKSIDLQESSNNFYYRGSYYYYNEDYENAILDFNKALEIDPDNYSAIWELAINYVLNKNYQKGIDSFNRYLDMSKLTDEEKANVYGEIAYIYYECLNDFDKAIEFLNKSDEIDNNREWYYISMGDINFKLNNFDKANEYYNKAYEKSLEKGLEFISTTIITLNSRINFYIATEQYEKAMIDIEDLKSLDDQLPSSFFKEAYINNKLGKIKSLNDISKAISLYESLLDDDPVMELKTKLFESENHIILGTLGYLQERIYLSDLYLFRADLYKKYGDMDEYCNDLNAALDFVKKGEVKRIEKLQLLIDSNCN